MTTSSLVGTNPNPFFRSFFLPTHFHQSRHQHVARQARPEADISLEFDMRSLFDFQSSPSPSSFGMEMFDLSLSKRPETVDCSLELLSSNLNSRQPHGNACGEGRSRVSSPQAMMRELGELIAPRQPAKVLYPLLAADLRHYCPDISDRRVRSLYNGEVSRLWDDEALAIRMALSHRKNAAARRAFARAAADLAKVLASEGVPLTTDQHRVVVSMAEGALA